MTIVYAHPQLYRKNVPLKHKRHPFGSRHPWILGEFIGETKVEGSLYSLVTWIVGIATWQRNKGKPTVMFSNG